jgi:signal transduction histidine kinase
MRWFLSVLVIAAAGRMQAGSAGDTAGELPISLTAELRSGLLADEVTARRVCVRGAVSGMGEGIVNEFSPHPARRGFCVEDESGGIWVATKPAIREGLIDDQPALFRAMAYGTVVEVHGLLDHGSGQPLILPTKIQLLGEGDLMPAEPAKLGSFLSGGDEMRRVTAKGVVQDVTDEATRDNRWVLRVETGIGHFFVRVLKGDRYSPRDLLDAKLQVTGLVTSSRNWRSEFVCPRLMVRRHEDIVILKPAPADPFSVSAVSLANLNTSSSEGRSVHRRRVMGTVTYNDKQSLMYIQDEDVGVRVQTSEPSDVRVGERVEVAGFIDTSEYLSGLRGAVVRRLVDTTATPELPVPIVTDDFARYNQRVLLGLRMLPPSVSCEGRLTQISGELLNFRPATAQSPNLLEVKWGDAITTALLPGKIDPLLPGTQVTVTGIARVSADAAGETVKTVSPTRVDLLLRDAADIEVLSRPSWWTAQRVFVALGVVLAVAIAAFAWAFILQRMLQLRTQQLAAEVRNRRDAAIEFQAAMRERTRLAVDLHDTVLQTMAGIAFQIDACRGSQTEVSRQYLNYLETAGRMARNGQEDLRNVVWALRCLPLEDGSLLDSMRAIARQVSQRYGIAMRVHCDGELPPLADFVAGNLLLVIQEASHNAVKHANANLIEVFVSLDAGGDRVTVLVRDNGVGFEVGSRPLASEGHFGIEGMRQRVQRMGGVLEIESEIELGTEVRAEIPLRVFDAVIA